MSWCDKLASTPTVGFRLNTHFASGDALLQAWSPILDRLPVGEKHRFSMERHDSFGINLNTDEGWTYGADSSRVHVSFRHKMKAKPVSGGPPVMEMLSRPLPFTELLPEASKKLIEATLALPGAKVRTVNRIGIVATTLVDAIDLPPGIIRLIKYIGRPWKNLVDGFNIQLTTELNKTSMWSDRCLHTLLKPEDNEELMTLTFDWQRTFLSGRPVNSPSLEEILVAARKSSLKYFEDLAEGSQFDEEIIHNSAGT